MTLKKIIAIFTLNLAMVTLVKSQDVNDAKQLIENERYDSAETLLERNVGAEEPEPETGYLLLKTYLEQGQTDEATMFIAEYLSDSMNKEADPFIRLACARYLLNRGEKGSANEVFVSLTDDRKNQKNVSLLLAMAEVAVEEEDGDARAALAWLDMAEKRDKHDPAIDIIKGLAFTKLEDASNAFLSYQSALKRDPSNVRANYLMGKIFVSQKNPDIYMPYFVKAYKTDSTYAPVLEELYKHYYSRDVKQAKKYLEKYIANSDYSLQNDYYMTDMLYLNNDYQDAIKSANSIISKEQVNAQPRLYKLIAYSYAKSGDSLRALEAIQNYFAKEDPKKLIAADYQLIAQLTGRIHGMEETAISYYSIATEMDEITAHKAEYAAAIAELYKGTSNDAKQAEWLGKLYGWKEKTNNVDLFNLGLAWYKAKDYLKSDSVFAVYTDRYPNDIYGYYWRAQANASIDTSMSDSLAVPFYRKVVEIGEKNKETNKQMLLKALGYLGGYEANITKNYPASLDWFQKYLAIEENADVEKYVDMLNDWISKKKE